LENNARRVSRIIFSPFDFPGPPTLDSKSPLIQVRGEARLNGFRRLGQAHNVEALRRVEYRTTHRTLESRESWVHSLTLSAPSYYEVYVVREEGKKGDLFGDEEILYMLRRVESPAAWSTSTC